MADKINTAGDPNVQAGLGHLLTMFDPKAAAEGSALQARSRNFDAETRYNTARALGVEDQNSMLSDAALIAAGVTDPMERAVLRFTRSNSVADVFGGRNKNQAFNLLNKPGATDDDIRRAAIGLGFNSAGDKGFAGTSARADTLNTGEAASGLAKIVAGATIGARSREEVAKINGVTNTDVAKIRALSGNGKVDPNTLPFVTRDPAGDISRLFGMTKDDGTWVPPSEEEVVQPIMRTAQALIAAKAATRENAVERALAVLGLQAKKEVKKESSYGREKDVTYPKPAKAEPIGDVSVDENGMDAGELVVVPTDNLGLINDPNGPVVNAPEGTIVQIGNTAYRKVPGGLSRIK